jgi:glycosyltransferase involved in cell wall biosynthesis
MGQHHAEIKSHDWGPIMPNILLLCEFPTLNGGERSMLATLPGIRAAGFAPAVACPVEGPLADALRAEGVEIAPFSTFDGDGRKRSQPELREELATLLVRRRPAILHANSLSMGRLSGPVAAALRTPSIAHLRDIMNLSPQAAADLNCHRRLLAVSRAVKDFHTLGGLQGEIIFVLHNGIDLTQFRPRPATGFLHAELAIPHGSPLVAVVGQIGLRKGQDVFVRAAAEVHRQQPDVHFLVIGERFSDKAESRAFEAALHTTDVIGRLHFLGFRHDMERIFPELALLVHPARQEPLGRVLIEAAATGTAVVATAVGGTPEIFPPSAEAALLVSPDDPQKLAAAMLQVLGDPALRLQLQLAARRRAEAAFDIHLASAGLVEHYHSVLAY